MVAADAQWHLERRKEVLKANPELKQLDADKNGFWMSPPAIMVLVAVQWYFWYLVHEINFTPSVQNYALMGFLAWVNSTTIFYMLSTFIHENSHGLIFGFKMNRRIAAAALIELGFCSFGEQWEYTVVHYTMHHPQLNDGARDSECPGEGHVAVPPKSGIMKYLVPIIELFPLGTLLTQGQLSNNAQHGSTNNMSGPQNILIGVSATVYAFLIYNGMYHSALFAAWTTSLYSSRWCISLHGQSISEHYRHNFEPKQDGKQVPPTHSTYYFLENFVGFNTGYHDEHHTFPNVPWYHLPTLKKVAPDTFNNVNERRYLDLWWEWASHGFETTRFRICHNPAAA